MLNLPEFPLSDEACPHCWDQQALRILPPGQAVHKDECAYCCHTVQHDGGIFVCAACFVGVCPSHVAKHFGLSHHSMYVVVQQLPPQPVPEDATRDTNLLGVAPPPEFETGLVCYPCRQQHTPGVGETFDCFSAIVSTTSVAVSDSITQNAWYQNRRECPHVLSLVQTSSPFPPGACPDGSTKCGSCDIKQNNWMCLTCGNVGCPRKDAQGNEHAILHRLISGHHVVVKLGTATVDGADMYCYQCDDEVKDSRLAEHLATFGIDLRTTKKTSKSLGEMEYERTMQHDFGKITESSAKLEPVFGPGRTGLRNFGNTCYMASVLQCLFALKPFQRRFSGNHRANCAAPDPYSCYECQTERLVDGLLSGTYSQAQSPERLRGVTPRAFKKLFTKGHVDFSTGQQQDAQEFLVFILKELSRRIVHTDALPDPTRVADFALEERQECSACHGVRYKKSLQQCLSLTLPISPPTPLPPSATEAMIDAARPTTSLDDCLAAFLLPSDLDRVCSQCKQAATYQCTSRLASFPELLVVHVRREYFDRSSQQVRKMDAYVDMPLEVDMIRLRSAGPQPSERIMEVEAEAAPGGAKAGGGAPVAEPDEIALATMLSMGIDIPLATWALQQTDNNVERAIDYYFSHPEGPAAATTPESAPAAQTQAVLVQPATDGAPQYRLRAMISHIGASALTGHYLCHIFDPASQKWYIFNDEAVAESQNPPFRMASLYFYTRVEADV